jgi:hypothetical protein
MQRQPLLRQPELLLRLLAVGDIRESDHSARQPTLFIDGRARILDGEAGAILSPEHLGGRAMHCPVPIGGVDRTLFSGVGTSVRFGMVPGAVAGTAEKLFGCVAQHPCRGRVDERVVTLRIQPQNPFRRRAQDKFILLVETRQVFLRLLALGQVGGNAEDSFLAAPRGDFGANVHGQGRAIFAEVRRFEGCFAALAQFLHSRGDQPFGGRHIKLPQVKRQELIPAVAVQLKGSLVGVEEAPVEVIHGNRVGGGVHRQRHPADFLLGLPALGDVAASNEDDLLFSPGSIPSGDLDWKDGPIPLAVKA